ncbi:cytokine receptor-like isoform X2 [Stegodyphus dumicola]|uniref:cytokine receptor-like isoform X2 n=1 Tax=Stegodyphus dumicola TaxID=202533 RepID=UPI0015AEBACA|nr:cytokine receptor-like isoform X2 [Stegodyphus dumicola]
MFRSLYSQTLILQILLITVVACQSPPNPSGGTLTTYFTDIKPSSVILHWNVPSENKYHCEPHLSLKYKIQYHPVHETKHKEAWPGSPTDSIQLLNLIPNTRYKFIFRCRPCSEQNDSAWLFSKGFYMTTPPDIPYWAPEIANSSFSSEIEDFEEAKKSLNLFRYIHRRTITIYWKNIPAEYENGEKFQYWIRASSPFRPYLTKEVSASRETSYSFTGMLPGVVYRFEIFGGNVVGNSSNSSEIIVREESSLLDGLERIIFLSRTHDYEMFFFPGRDQVKYYTLFWCKSAQPRPVKCEDSLQWLNLPWDGISYHLRLSEKSIDYQFAVSANSETETSGMIWAHCHISENEEHILDKLWTVCLSFINLLKAGPSGIWRRTEGILYL